MIWKEDIAQWWKCWCNIYLRKATNDIEEWLIIAIIVIVFVVLVTGID